MAQWVKNACLARLMTSVQPLEPIHIKVEGKTGPIKLSSDLYIYMYLLMIINKMKKLK